MNNALLLIEERPSKILNKNLKVIKERANIILSYEHFRRNQTDKKCHFTLITSSIYLAYDSELLRRLFP